MQSKTSGVKIYLPNIPRFEGAFSFLGFSTKSIIGYKFFSIGLSYFIIPYVSILCFGTCSTAMIEALYFLNFSINCFVHGFFEKTISSPSITAKASFPTCFSAHNIAWPSPRAFFWRTY